ncbi:MAG: hypothetical protein AAGB30_11050 [Pedobacter sp.]|nr:hypothetical protein [Pedobacter sp.]
MSKGIDTNKKFEWGPTQQAGTALDIQAMLKVSIRMQARILAKLENRDINEILDSTQNEIDDMVTRIASNLIKE